MARAMGVRRSPAESSGVARVMASSAMNVSSAMRSLPRVIMGTPSDASTSTSHSAAALGTLGSQRRLLAMLGTPRSRRARSVPSRASRSAESSPSPNVSAW
jgi:hypothetical protein